MDVMPLKVNSP